MEAYKGNPVPTDFYEKVYCDVAGNGDDPELLGKKQHYCGLFLFLLLTAAHLQYAVRRICSAGPCFATINSCQQFANYLSGAAFLLNLAPAVQLDPERNGGEPRVTLTTQANASYIRATGRADLGYNTFYRGAIVASRSESIAAECNGVPQAETHASTAALRGHRGPEARLTDGERDL